MQILKFSQNVKESMCVYISFFGHYMRKSISILKDALTIIIVSPPPALDIDLWGGGGGVTRRPYL